MLTRTQEARPRPGHSRPRPRPRTYEFKIKAKTKDFPYQGHKKLEPNQETSATMAQYLNKQAQSQSKLKHLKVNSLPDRLWHESVTWLSAWCTISRTNWQGQGLSRKAKDLKQVLWDRPRPRTCIADSDGLLMCTFHEFMKRWVFFFKFHFWSFFINRIKIL